MNSAFAFGLRMHPWERGLPYELLTCPWIAACPLYVFQNLVELCLLYLFLIVKLSPVGEGDDALPEEHSQLL